MPLRLLAFLAAIGLVWSGGQGVLTASTSRQPSATTCADFTAGKVDSKWLELRDCLAFLPGGSHFYRENSDPHGPADQVYIPLYVPTAQDGETAHVVMATRDPAILAIYNGFPYGANGDVQKAYIEKHADRMNEVRTVRGLVRFGVDLDDRERGMLVGEGIADDFIIVDEGAEPEMGTSLFMIVGGLVLGLGVLASWLSGRDPDTPVRG